MSSFLEARRVSWPLSLSGELGLLCTHLWLGPRAQEGKILPRLCFSPQDLAWAISYYTRFFITYIPFYGVLGSILFLNFIRCLSFAGY